MYVRQPSVYELDPMLQWQLQRGHLRAAQSGVSNER
jgi:hypothetical protein